MVKFQRIAENGIGVRIAVFRWDYPVRTDPPQPDPYRLALDIVSLKTRIKNLRCERLDVYEELKALEALKLANALAAQKDIEDFDAASR